jgi:hypothetical protein
VTPFPRALRWSVLAALLLVAAAGCGDDAAPPEAAPPGDTRPTPTAEPEPDPQPAQVHTHDTLFEISTTTRPDGRHERHLATEPEGEVVTIEVSEHEPGAEPTPEQQAAAEEFADAVRAATAGLERLEDARAAGYEHWPGIDELHFANLDHVTDGEVLDPERPEFLMYDGDGDLLAAMFLAESNQAAGPQFGGPLTTWHYHPAGPSCWDGGGLLPASEEPTGEGECPGDLIYSERSPEMLHVWVVDHDDGPFSSDMVSPLFPS